MNDTNPYALKIMFNIKLNLLSLEALNKMPTHRLLKHLKSVTAVISSIYNYAGPRCCEVCHDYIGSDIENDVKIPSRKYVDYKTVVKSVLAKREHIETTKRLPTFRRAKKRKRIGNWFKTISGRKMCTLCNRPKKDCKRHFPHEYVVDGSIKIRNSITY